MVLNFDKYVKSDKEKRSTYFYKYFWSENLSNGKYGGETIYSINTLLYMLLNTKGISVPEKPLTRKEHNKLVNLLKKHYNNHLENSNIVYYKIDGKHAQFFDKLNSNSTKINPKILYILTSDEYSGNLKDALVFYTYNIRCFGNYMPLPRKKIPGSSITMNQEKGLNYKDDPSAYYKDLCRRANADNKVATFINESYNVKNYDDFIELMGLKKLMLNDEKLDNCKTEQDFITYLNNASNFVRERNQKYKKMYHRYLTDDVVIKLIGLPDLKKNHNRIILLLMQAGIPLNYKQIENAIKMDHGSVNKICNELIRGIDINGVKLKFIRQIFDDNITYFEINPQVYAYLNNSK